MAYASNPWLSAMARTVVESSPPLSRTTALDLTIPKSSAAPFLRRENDNRRAAGKRDRTAAAAGGHGDVLPPRPLVGDNAAGDRATGVEAIEFFPGARIEDEEISVEIAGEEHIA